MRTQTRAGLPPRLQLSTIESGLLPNVLRTAMLWKLAICTVWHEREKLAGAVVGVAFGVFLVIFQWGLYFAYQRDTTIVLDAFDADIWIVPKNQSMFDGFTYMDDLPYWRAKAVSGVEDVARVVWGDAAWRTPLSGGKDYVQVLGIDLDSSIAVRFHLPGRDVARLVRPEGHVLVGTKDREKLGLTAQPGGPFEISGRQDIRGGLCGRRSPLHDGRVRADRRGQCPRVLATAVFARQLYRLQVPSRCKRGGRRAAVAGGRPGARRIDHAGNSTISVPTIGRPSAGSDR